MIPHSVSSVEDQKMIITIKLELVEAEHKFLEDRLCLECDGAVQIGLVLRPQHSAVDLSVQLLQEMSLAQGRHVIC